MFLAALRHNGVIANSCATKPPIRSSIYLPTRLSDNPDLPESGYAAVLAGLPEELRRAYRDGDFRGGLKDHQFQVIPAAWIEATHLPG